jgi:hypothetical protein
VSGKTTITRRQRRAAREEAAQRIDTVAEHATEVRQNDVIGSHFTVWLNPVDRVEWWPGARHWRIGSDDFHGDFNDFIDWLKR